MSPYSNRERASPSPFLNCSLVFWEKTDCSLSPQAEFGNTVCVHLSLAVYKLASTCFHQLDVRSHGEKHKEAGLWFNFLLKDTSKTVQITLP